MIKIYQDFTDAAIQGAKAVVDRQLMPLNPMDPNFQ